MKTLTIQDQNEVYNTSSLLVNTCKNILNFIKTKALAFFYRIIDTFRLSHTHPAIKIENIHKSYKKMNQSSQQVFILYVKGYSLDEISSKSGVTPNKIFLIVNDFLKSLHKENYIS